MKWKKNLEVFYNKYQYNFLVQKFTDFPFPWIKYNTSEYKDFVKKELFVNHREVFYDEVIFDIDMDKEMLTPLAIVEAQRIAAIISDRLSEDLISHKIYNSGGTGVHIHCFFPELEKASNRDLMKEAIISYYSKGFTEAIKNSGKVQLVKNTLIQLEDAPHRKGGTKKLYKEKNFNFPNIIIHDIKVVMEIIDIKKQSLKKVVLTNQNDKPASIVYLESSGFANKKDGRDRALFILCSYYKQFYDTEQVFNILSKWNNVILNNYFSEKVIRAKIKSCKPCFPYRYVIDTFDELNISEEVIL